MNINAQIDITEHVSADDIIQILLKNRGIINYEEFLHPVHPRDIRLATFFKNPSKHAHNWKKTLKILKSIKKNGEMIVVYTDYDADGITGGAILWKTLDALGFKAMPYVPDRKKEGYGFSKEGVESIKKMYDPALIISVDHGIVADEYITYAKELGIQVIVTDHHQKKKTIPRDALAIFHIQELSGSGVAYFFAKELAQELDEEKKVLRFFDDDFLALASIGTVADLIPLVGSARSITQYGLESFKKIEQIGLKELLKEAGIIDKNITTYDIGFLIAPRINAFGRLTHGIDALRLLCTNSYEKARGLARQANQTNTQRQNLVQKGLEEAEKTAKTSSKIIILHNDDWEEGIIGLIAGKISNKYYKPAIVISGTNGVARGSARSIPGFNITDFLRKLERYFIDVGGHKAAAGFSIHKKNILPFKKAAEKLADREISEKMLVKVLHADIRTPLSNITIRLAREIERLEPFGVGNEAPVFCSEALVQNIEHMGKNKEHVRLLARWDDMTYSCVYFNGSDVLKKITKGEIIVMLYSAKIDRWRDKERLDLVVKYVEAANSSYV